MTRCKKGMDWVKYYLLIHELLHINYVMGVINNGLYLTIHRKQPFYLDTSPSSTSLFLLGVSWPF